MEELDVDDVYQHYLLDPSEVDAITYFLPRLIAGETLHGAEKFIHRVDIYGCEPKDLAAQFAPQPQAASKGARFFFTTCKAKNGSKVMSVRSAGGGTWSIQGTKVINYAGVKVGEKKTLSFKKKGKVTGWVMEEYRCLLPEATVADGMKVFCKIHLAPNAPDAARHESAAYKRQQQQEQQSEPVTAVMHKRPAPVAAADPHPKKMRLDVPVPAPVIAAVPEEEVADDDMSRFSCSMEELFGFEDILEPDELQRILADVGEEILHPIEAVTEQQQQQPQAFSSYNDLHAPSLGGHHSNDLHAPPPIFNDPFEAARIREELQEAEWQAQEALQKEKSYNADLYLGGHHRFFSSSMSVH